MTRRRCARIEARQPQRLPVGQPGRPVRTLADRGDRRPQQTVAAGEQAPLAAIPQGHAFIGREPHPAGGTEAEHAGFHVRGFSGQGQSVETQPARGLPAAENTPGCDHPERAAPVEFEAGDFSARKAARSSVDLRAGVAGIEAQDFARGPPGANGSSRVGGRRRRAIPKPGGQGPRGARVCAGRPGARVPEWWRPKWFRADPWSGEKLKDRPVPPSPSRTPTARIPNGAPVPSRRCRSRASPRDPAERSVLPLRASLDRGGSPASRSCL